jgi:tRNA(fMet)-specific endonuclease VapC
VGVLIDTGVFIEQERGGRSLEEAVGDEAWGISVITVSELLHGIHRATGAVRARRQAWVEELLAGAEAVPITTPVARVHAELWSSLARRGKMPGQHDLWIAASALAHGLGVVTLNQRDFARVPGLRLVAP